MKILFIASNPATTNQLMLDEEIRRIQQEISQSKYRSEINFRSSLAVRPNDLIRELNEQRPDILHISSHGSNDGALILTAEDGGSAPISGEIITELFSTLEKAPQLVLFNACFSITQADGFCKYVDIAVGMPDVVGDKDAIEFSSVFYSSLCSGLNFHDSFRQAVIGVKLNNGNYWQNGEPTYLTKENISAKNIFFTGAKHSLPTKQGITKEYRKIFKDRDLGRGFIKREFIEFASKLERLSAVFFDIEGMNKINERFGRNIGNKVISETFLIITENSPDAVAIGFCGDDTFFVLLEKLNRTEVIAYARNVMVEIDSNSWSRIASELFVRVAAGYAVQNPNEDVKSTLDRAGIGLRTAQNTNSGVAEASDNQNQKIRGEPFEKKGKISEDEIMKWFS